MATQPKEAPRAPDVAQRPAPRAACAKSASATGDLELRLGEAEKAVREERSRFCQRRRRPDFSGIGTWGN